MNKLDKQYQQLLQDIVDYGVEKKDRTGTGTKSIFGYTIRHKMSDGFPLLTTKKMAWKTMVTELLWFLKGDTNIKYLVDNDCHIWDGDAYKNYCTAYKDGHEFYEDEQVKRSFTQEEFISKIKTDDEFAKTWGELGPIYGKQWRKWEHYDEIGQHYSSKTKKIEESDILRRKPVDQIANLINDLKTNPDSRRLMVNAWAVHDLPNMVLPPCHYGFQVYTRELSLEERMNLIQGDEHTKIIVTYCENPSDTWLEGQIDILLDQQNIPTRAISLMWNQRSVDTFLGLPFNIASYGLLLEIIAKEVNMVADELIGNLGDTHLYLNHIEQAKEQIGRELTLEERLEFSKENKDLLVKLGAFSSEYEIMRLCDEHFIPKTTRDPFELPKLKLRGWLGAMTSNQIREEGLLTMIDNGSISPYYFQLENYQSHPPIKAPLSN
jgi:thymidylate synthase